MDLRKYLCNANGLFANLKNSSRIYQFLFFLLLAPIFSGSVKNLGYAQDVKNAVQNGFRIKYVATDAVYIPGGRASGLSVGQTLEVKRIPGGQSPDTGALHGDNEAPTETTETIAVMEVVTVADASAVCEIKSSQSAIRQGDIAFLSDGDTEKLKAQLTTAETESYPQVISFTEGNPLEKEMRENVPSPRLPEINRARGRVALEFNNITDQTGDGLNSKQVGIALRMDVTRLGGTYWNLGGYYRGRLNSRTLGPDQETLTDLINRTYHLSLTYNSPQSNWVAGAGRLYLPWASSLGTIDGGYFGRRTGRTATFGIFGGTAPDPTFWNYDKDRQLGGVFASFNIGNIESVRMTSTIGLALSGIQWKSDRRFAFFENVFSYKHYLSVFHNMETDLMLDPSLSGERNLAVSRSYLTARFQPIRFIGFDFSHNYFRNIPTFDPRLIGTGLVDNLLFEGFNGGIRLELPYTIRLYSNLGRSQKTGDPNTSLNRTYGMSVGRIWKTGVRADFRYSSFDNSFGKGLYRSLSIGRDIGSVFRFSIRGGQQDFISASTTRNRARWLNMDSDLFLSRHYVLGAGFTIYRGLSQKYDQWYVNLGYRF